MIQMYGKSAESFREMMRKAGFKPQHALRTWVKMNKWQLVERTERFDLSWTLGIRKAGTDFAIGF